MIKRAVGRLDEIAWEISDVGVTLREANFSFGKIKITRWTSRTLKLVGNEPRRSNRTGLDRGLDALPSGRDCWLEPFGCRRARGQG